MLEDIKVRFLQDIKINIFDIDINAKQDDTLIIPRWLALLLRDAKLVEINGQDMSIELTRILSREKLTGTDQLVSLKPDLYIKINKFIQDTKESEREKLMIYLHDLIDIRLWKILNIVRSTTIIPEVEQKLTIEEKILFNTMYKAINEFKNMVLR